MILKKLKYFLNNLYKKSFILNNNIKVHFNSCAAYYFIICSNFERDLSE